MSFDSEPRIRERAVANDRPEVVAATSGDSLVHRVAVDGVPIDALTEAEVVTQVMTSLHNRVGGVIITANADQMRRLHSEDYRPMVDSAALIVADGMPLVWASRLMRDPLPERVNGTNLLVALCKASVTRSRRVFLLGAAPGVGEEAAQALGRLAPGLNVCGVHSPPLGFEEDPQGWTLLVDAVRTAGPDLVFVALGFPKQEHVGLRLREELPEAWFMGCGGALDLLSGRLDRAPVIFQRLGAEWVHRLVQEPRRLARRYLVDDAPYVIAMLARARRSRLRRTVGTRA